MLFDTTSLGELTLDNRVGLAPMTRVSATDDGRATDRMAQYYAKFAEGGFSFLVTEGVYTDDAYSKGYRNQPGLVTDDHVDAWTRVTDAVHDADSAVFAQLMHSGAQNQGFHRTPTRRPSRRRQSSRTARKTRHTVAMVRIPSRRRPRGTTSPRRARGSSRRRRLTHDAGFDGVELHGANGYFLNEFLSKKMNQRDDEYGGEPDARVRYPAEVVGQSREQCRRLRRRHPGITVDGDRLRLRGPPEGEDAAAVFFEELSTAGADYIHTTERYATEPTFGDDGPSLAEAARKYVTDDTVVIANGGLGTPETARQVLEDGADLLTLGTSALANPDWPETRRCGRRHR